MKVNVRRVGTGVAAMSTLVVAAGGSSLGCATEGDLEQEALGTSESALTAGSATLELSLGGSVGGAFHLNLISSTTDEFVRVGESLSLSLPGWILWDTVHPNLYGSSTDIQKKIRASVEVFFYDQGTQIGSQTVMLKDWTGPSYSLFANTESFIVPAKADRMEFEITVRDADDPAAVGTIKADRINTIQVFGGELPNKTVIFDNNFGALRQRIIEGENLVHGAKASIFYTDWRADVLIDRSRIDAQIGVAKSYGRFGSYEMPIYGKVVHEISYGVSYDDGQGWRSEKPLTPNTQSALGWGRTNFEATETIPAAATEMEVYFHVKTYVVADYSGYSNVTQKWYGDGQQILKQDRYDNPNGSYTNYEFPLQ